MAEFPLDPSLSKTLIISTELGCAEEVLTVTAMLSVENPFYRPKDKAPQADAKRAKFLHPDGDHVTLLIVYCLDGCQVCCAMVFREFYSGS